LGVIKASIERISPRASLDGKAGVALCVKTQCGADRGLAEKIGAIFGMIFNAHEQLDIIFLSDQQGSQLTRVCSPFFNSHNWCFVHRLSTSSSGYDGIDNGAMFPFGYEFMLRLSDRWGPILVSQPETGMAYQIASIILRNGSRYDQAIIESGFITRIRSVKAGSELTIDTAVALE
jgi:hypothetical protein